jgi:hypothetical protein
VSYFDSLFSPNDYSKIFVLKGGPGTGKNSLMKKVRDAFMTNGYITEEIYCSSDTSSLDGIIIESEKEKIAVIDGTAPHERDAIIPGAIDIIINLGDNWNERWLTASRNKITPLCHEKSTAYRTAYYYLSLAGVAHEKIISLAKSRYSAQKFKTRLKSLAEYLGEDNLSKLSVRLISSVGRAGAVRFDTLDTPLGKHFCVVGSLEEKLIFMTELASALYDRAGICASSPLVPELSEGVYLKDTDVSFTFEGEGELIDASEVFSAPTETECERVRVARSVLRDATEEAVRWFGIASDMHFRLEEIYSVAMDFEKNDRMLAETQEKILEILCL